METAHLGTFFMMHRVIQAAQGRWSTLWCECVYIARLSGFKLHSVDALSATHTQTRVSYGSQIVT